MSEITIILTSYNRPRLLRRTLESLLGQNDPDWHCILIDDGSNSKTHDVIMALTRDARFDVELRNTRQQQREETTRFSVLLNDRLENLRDGIVGYLCDNVEYDTALVGAVRQFFDVHPAIFAGYVPHRRDAWLADGRDGIGRLGDADEFGHWKMTPPQLLRQLGLGQVDGRLDHSQVFHRLPTSVRWSEGPEYRHHADGLFFERLVQAHGPIHRITTEPLTHEHLLIQPLPA